MKKFKETGITLIALMITIIVLLILAGVTLNLTLGERGIFKVAKSATENYIKAENKEMADLATLYSEITIAGDSQITLTKEQLDEYINKKVDEKLIDIKDKIESQNEEHKQIKSSIKVGEAVIGDIEGNAGKTIHISFNENMPNNENYAVIVTTSKGLNNWGNVTYKVQQKNIEGFDLRAWNFNSSTAAGISINYIVIPYTEI